MLKIPVRIIPTNLPDDEVVFQKLANGLDAVYANIDNTFTQVRMDQVPRPGRLKNGQAAIENAGVFLRQVHVVPFSFKDAETAVWSHIIGGPGNQVLLSHMQLTRWIILT